jgi:hypothetical protein
MRALIATMFLAFCSPALANDTTAEIAAGGIVLTRSDSIEMRSEDLYVSAKQIRVKYQFFNTSAADITTIVAFPMPDLVAETDNMYGLPSDDANNPLKFTTAADGKPVKIEIEQKAMARGVDHSKLLRDLNIPLAHYRDDTNKALDALPREKQDELIALGLAEITEYDVGNGMERHVEARWALKMTYHWQQTFPAGRELAIEHSYMPITGGSVMTSIAGPASRSEEWWDDYNRKYCPDSVFLNAVNRASKAANSDFGSPFEEERIGYVLKTGANWSGPIGDFRLVVDKGAVANLVSFCGEGVKKITPTQFEIRKRDFTPKEDLYVLILKPIPKN